jgi:hypothetical protein
MMYLLAAALASTIAVAPDPPALAAPTPQQQTLDSMRTIGVALFRWHADRYPAGTAGADGELSAADLGQIPVVDLAELERELVPAYAAELPRADGWGRAFEVRLLRGRRDHLMFSIRSAGADGRFEGTLYPVGAFPAAETDHDPVWVDGYFVRWPAR